MILNLTGVDIFDIFNNDRNERFTDYPDEKDNRMEDTNITQELATLPPEARKMVGEFVSFLKDRYPKALPFRKTRRRKLTEEPFIGMWKDREDFQDSTGWVRGFRAREWGRGK